MNTKPARHVVPLFALACAVGITTSAGELRAQPVSAPAPTAPAPVLAPAAPRYESLESHYQWYGLPTIFIDVASVALFHVGLATGSQPVTAIGAVVFVGGSPVVHFANGNVGKGFAAAGIRLGSPVILGTIGLLIGLAGSSRTDLGTLAGAALGAFVGFEIGVAGASVLDIALLSEKKVSGPAPAGDTGARLLPNLGVARDIGDRRVPTLGLTLSM
jgi:hypothetical protein